MIPDLWSLRRVVLPIAEKLDKSLFGDSYKFAYRMQETERVGVMDVEAYEARHLLREMSDVYPNNLAAAKYVTIDGKRVFDAGSYAHRPAGFFSTYQTHLRLIPDGEQTIVYAHYEYNPWMQPRAHYGGVDWNAEKGVEIAENLLGEHIQ